MKVEQIAPSAFKPIQITIETEKEAALVYRLFGCLPLNVLEAFGFDASSDPTHYAWRKLGDELNAVSADVGRGLNVGFADESSLKL